MPGQNRQALIKFWMSYADTYRMIEGGIPGGSALHHAGQRRATADRLVLEANWLETIAADQNKMSGVLAGLPPAYSILHDLNVPGSKGTIDHVIIGPGGAFIVISRRYGEHIDYRDGQLWAGDRSMKSVLDGARVESELMSQTLATPVVPVLALLDALLPAATPGVVDGVMVTSDDNIVRVITRGAHTLLTPDKVADITQRAMPMLHTPQSVRRSDDSTGVRSDPLAPPMSTVAAMPPPVPAPMPMPVLEAAPVPMMAAAAVAATPTFVDEPRQPKLKIAKPEKPQRVSRRERREHSGHRRSALSVVAIIVGLCLVAVALGSLARLAFSKDEGASSPTLAPSTTASPSTSSSTIATTTTLPVMNSLPAPIVQYTPMCPTPGAGWEMVPTWPGDIEGLKEYDVEMLITDSWVSLASWTRADEQTSATLHGQPANATYTIRITAVLLDESRSAATPTPITTPATEC